jgi:chorismate synthase
MAGSTFGKEFSMITFGESHGPFVGVVIDGIKPGIPIDISEIQKDLNRRRPGQSQITTPRSEKDQVEIISGIFEGKTTGTPICMLIKNEDQRSKDYSNIKNIFRPGHASYTFLKKYGIFDYRGGGRSSGRETAGRVAAGAIAKQILKNYGIRFIGFTRQVGPIRAEKIQYDRIEKNAVRCPDPDAAEKMEGYIKEIARNGDSIGGVVEVHILGVPAGLGDPVFEKLDAELARAIMSIGAVKGVEIGEGFRVAEMKGSENNDPFEVDDQGHIHMKTNHAGGILGGISTGDPIVIRLAVKPPSSIQIPQQSVTHDGKMTEFSVQGRHDPCICPRVVPVAEAMAALVILDLLLIQQRIRDKMQNIDEIRQEIDLIDTQLLLLLKSRYDLVKKMARIKKEQSLEILSERREKEIFNQIQRFAEQIELPAEFIKTLWEQILRMSRDLQNKEMSDG